MSLQATAQRLPALDILRGLAACWVILLHVVAHTGWTSFPVSGPLAIIRAGSLAMDLFFVISGFVIYASACTLYQPGEFGSFLRRFAIRRAFRLYPLYVITLFAALALIHPYLWHPAVFWEHLLSHLAFVHPFHPDWFSSINGVTWSIGIEVHFYIVLALLTPLLARTGVIGPVLGFIVIAWAWRLLAFRTFPDATTVTANYHLFVLATQLPGRLDQFGVGMLIAALVRTGAFARVNAHPQSKWLALAAAALAFNWLVYPLPAFWRSAEAAFVLVGTVNAMVFGAVVIAACLWDGDRFLRLTWAPRYAGTISYGLYLWHLPVLMLLKNSGAPPWLVAVLTLGLTTALAVLSWRLIEQPMQALGRRLELRGTAAATTAGGVAAGR